METVLKEVCRKQTEKFDSQLSRDSARLRELENMQREFLRLSSQMTEMLRTHSEQLDGHEGRLVSLEKRPGAWFDRIAAALISAAVTAVVAAFL